ncbi:MAG: acylneuraminate cytidylyltransferase family protein [Candidatus Yonathbacteria bacterium]|nr:acylneuraminate cytidylyltransferase family protein [Candidatus Yonathbacteria bacterium]
MKPYIIGAIFARGGSKGVPRKNIRLLAGKPLIAYAIETARAVSDIDRVIISTDDAEIAQVAKQYGADVPFMRPSELAQDKSPEFLAWKHAIEAVEKELGHAVDVMVSVPTTSPMRSFEDVAACLKLLLESDADIVITVTEANRSPYFNMVTIDGEKNARLVIPPAGGGAVVRRQDAPVVYDMTTVCYAVRGAYIKTTSAVLAGKVKAVVVPKDRALDIDTLLDFEMAEFLMSRK